VGIIPVRSASRRIREHDDYRFTVCARHYVQETDNIVNVIGVFSLTNRPTIVMTVVVHVRIADRRGRTIRFRNVREPGWGGGPRSRRQRYRKAK